MIRLLLVLFFSFSLYAQTGDLDMFDQFEKQDKQEFVHLKKQIEKCIKNWNFSCAQKKLAQIKNYATTKKDVQDIRNLKTELADARYEKRRQDEERRLKEELARAHKSVQIGNCQRGTNSYEMCQLFVDRKRDGFIFYKLKDTNTYDIYIQGSKSVAAGNGGYYSMSLNSVWTTQCGDSVFGHHAKRIFVYNLSKALYLYANCFVNGKY